MENGTSCSLTFSGFNGLSSHLGQSAEKETNWRKTRLNWQFPTPFYDNAGSFVRLLALAVSLNLSFIHLAWWKPGWKTSKGEGTNPWPGKSQLGPGTESGLPFPEKIVWPCWEKKSIQRVAVILYFSRVPACSLVGKHDALKEGNMMPHSLALAVWPWGRNRILPCSSSNKCTVLEEDSISLAPPWGMKRN